MCCQNDRAAGEWRTACRSDGWHHASQTNKKHEIFETKSIDHETGFGNSRHCHRIHRVPNSRCDRNNRHIFPPIYRNLWSAPMSSHSVVWTQSHRRSDAWPFEIPSWYCCLLLWCGNGPATRKTIDRETNEWDDVLILENKNLCANSEELARKTSDRVRCVPQWRSTSILLHLPPPLRYAICLHFHTFFFFLLWFTIVVVDPKTDYRFGWTSVPFLVLHIHQFERLRICWKEIILLCWDIVLVLN